MDFKINNRTVYISKEEQGYTISYYTADGLVDDGYFQSEEEAKESFIELTNEFPNLVTN